MISAIKKILANLELAGALFLAPLMVALYVSGVRHVYWGVKLLVVEHDAIRAFADILSGIELFFLAPLVLLAYVSSILFVKGFFRRHDNPTSVAKTSGPLNPYSGLFHSIKEATAALVVAIALTDLLGKSLGPSFPNWLALASECAPVLLGLLYLLVLVKASKGHTA